MGRRTGDRDHPRNRRPPAGVTRRRSRSVSELAGLAVDRICESMKTIVKPMEGPLASSGGSWGRPCLATAVSFSSSIRGS